MDLTKIIAVSGKPGLFELVSQTKSGMLVESLIDGSKIPVFATDRVSSLEDISIFTTGEDMPLREVLVNMFKNLNGEKTIDPKSDKKELLAFMDKVLPEWDSERVYPSDIKKLLTWYNILLDRNLIDEEEPVEESTDEKAE
ncbi:MAG: hypothetical protein CVU11_04455 [Bacteroidetes bacterium HGW-Bacteroidetes-6]|jgi:hypothetical protein|nr:MAG: hypothetical protein CVU11_04455 [Bacteroidetes bacterium HGW-Bacteroidetes-6]